MHNFEGSNASVCAVACDAEHGVSERRAEMITLLTGLGVAGDAHAGETVQHRSRVARDPSQPNLRQVHLIHAELLELGDEAVVEVTGLRNPCRQLEQIQAGLMAATLDRDADGGLVRKAGVMGVVVRAGEVRAGDRIEVRLPATPHRPLTVV